MNDEAPRKIYKTLTIAIPQDAVRNELGEHIIDLKGMSLIADWKPELQEICEYLLISYLSTASRLIGSHGHDCTVYQMHKSMYFHMRNIYKEFNGRDFPF